jgi:septal ring factor EnvC (AmiA/AmiB activator)
VADAIPTDDVERQEQLVVDAGQEPEQTDEQPEVGDDGQEPDKPKTFSEDYVKRLRREGAANRKRLAEQEARLREFEDRDKSELDKLTEALAAQTERASTAELKLTRFEVAADRGLDLAVAEKWLNGETREEIEERADELTKLLAEQQKDTRNGRSGGSGGFDGGARVAPPEERKPEDAHNDFLLGALGRRKST